MIIFGFWRRHGIYEKLNRVADLENALNCAKKNCAEDDAGILFHRARLESRKENNDGVVDLIKTISPEKFLPEIQEEYFSFLGKTYDKMGKYNLAFATFEIQNEISRSLISSQRDNAETYFNNTIQLKQSWTSGNQLDWSAARTKVEDISLAFLVGFPRSGTTLLDSILRSHPGITVVEEKPMVDNMRKLFGRIPSISELNKLTDSDITVLKNEYINELKAYVDKSRISKLIIDKLPLNIRNVGLIHRVFPKAKFILSLRHPCDCVLSCFMQNFRINDAMANFLTLDQSAKLYAAVMELWQGYQNSLDLEVGVLKYEELVQDLRGTCMPLIHFLKLDWDDNLTVLDAVE